MSLIAKGKGDNDRGYQYLPDIATADVAFEAYGKTVEEMFTHAGLATEEVMVDLNTIKPVTKHKIELKNKDIGKLLYDFLEELVFLKDKDLLLFNKFELKITHTQKEYHLQGNMYGEVINQKQHTLMCDVKAITLHMFNVEQTTTGWKARVVLDI